MRDVERLAASDPRVVMLGPRYGGEKTWLLQNASVFVQPSAVEGLPIALMEAMACGRFCLVSDIPEHLEVVATNGSSWEPFRVRRRGRPRPKLEDALQRSATRRARRGRPAARAGRTYGWDPVADQTEVSPGPPCAGGRG